VTPTAEYRAVLLNDPCSYCGAPAAAIDHVTPRRRHSKLPRLSNRLAVIAGLDNWDNLTAACSRCNTR